MDISKNNVRHLVWGKIYEASNDFIHSVVLNQIGSDYEQIRNLICNQVYFTAVAPIRNKLIEKYE
jgi:hypothetical protein